MVCLSVCICWLKGLQMPRDTACKAALTQCWHARPQRPDAAIIVAAPNDAYVSKQSVIELVRALNLRCAPARPCSMCTPLHYKSSVSQCDVTLQEPARPRKGACLTRTRRSVQAVHTPQRALHWKYKG